MDILISACLRALRSLFTRGMFGVMALSLLVTIAALAGFTLLCSLLVAWFIGHAAALPLHGLGAILLWLSASAGAALVAWFLFPALMPAIASLFADRIAQVIETQEYALPARSQEREFWPEFLYDLRFAVHALLLNILLPAAFLIALPVLAIALLPFFFLLPFLLHIGFVALFYLLNGHLLGRQFFIMAARRHMPVAEAEMLRRRHGRTVLLAGVALMIVATLPIANFFAPFWGMALMVHLGRALNPQLRINNTIF